MESITTQRPRGFARACLDQVARGNRPLVEQMLGRPLGNDFPRDMAELLGHISAYLAADCPFLKTLQPRETVSEYRWSDRRKRKDPRRELRFSKSPAPDEGGKIWTAAAEEREGKGTLLELTKNSLVLTDGVGGRLEVRIPGRLRRQLTLSVGETVTIRYRSDWNVKQNTVRYVLLEVP